MIGFLNSELEEYVYIDMQEAVDIPATKLPIIEYAQLKVLYASA